MAETLADQADRERDERLRDEREKALQAQKDADERTERYMGADEFVVLGALISVKVKDGRNGGFQWRQFNEGSVIKAEEVDEEHLRHLVSDLLVAPKDAPEARFAGPAGTPKPGEPPNVPVTEQPVQSLPLDERQRRQQAAAEQAERDAQAQQQAADGRPRANASKEDWVGYAVSQRAEGQSEEDARAEAQALSRDDLRARYGG